MSKFFRSSLSVLLVVFLAMAMVTPCFAVGNASQSGWKSVSFTKTDDSSVSAPRRGSAGLEDLDEIYSADETVRVSIVLDDAATITKFPTEGIAANANAMSYRASLRTKQDSLAQRISALALDGEELDVVWHLTLAANVISANVKYGRIGAIANVPGVRKVLVENRYEPQKAEESDKPANIGATEMTGATFVWGDYTGAGQIVAIIDTGLDTDHRSFDPGAFEYAISTLQGEFDLLTKDDIAAVLKSLNVYDRNNSVTARKLYINSKAPFGYNYCDDNYDVTHDNDDQGEHGSHVAGIAAANRFVKKDGEYVDALAEVLTQGEAPDAQILAMKVFGNNGGAYDSDYFAAVEDAIVLGASAANLSLGSGSAGDSFDEYYQDVMDYIAETDLVMVCSAGNSYSWSNSAMFGYNYLGDNNFDTTGSPGSLYNTLAVASVDNDSNTGFALDFYGNKVLYNESEYKNKPMTSLTGTKDYVFIDGLGTSADFSALGSIVRGKVVLLSRGEITFSEKCNKAASAGAIAIIVYNNQPGTINMDLSDYTKTVPAVSITQADGALVKSLSTAQTTAGGYTYYTGQVTMPTGVSTVIYNSKYYTMSDFSSWGVPGSLTLKPEITAPGGNIWSVNGAVAGGQAYENMSGTSMAAPQVTGLTALLRQYIEENDLVSETGLTVRQLIQSLLMSTATPLIEEGSGSYYSVLKQGAGLAAVDKAVGSKSYILMGDDATASSGDGKVKAEIGEISRDEKSFSFSFEVHNFSNEAVKYNFSADFFTQDIFYYYMYDANGDEAGTAYYLDTWTVPLEAAVTWNINGIDYVFEDASIYDFNGDGVTNTGDINVVLDYVVGNIDEFGNMEYADISEDGEIDSYDAYLLLDIINNATAILDPDDNFSIVVTVNLLDIDDYDLNGAYVEGYVFVTETDTGDGAIGVQHSIPVLGYYGQWSESPMFDHGSCIDAVYGTEELVPYMAASGLGEAASYVKAYIVTDPYGDQYEYVGNPYVTDSVYIPSRNAISGESTIDAVRYTLIRNASAGVITVVDGAGTVLYDNELGGERAAYYYVNGSKWMSTYTTKNIGFSPEGIEDGTVITASIKLATEYDYYREDFNWDDLAEGAEYSMSFTVDSTAPVLQSVAAHQNGDVYDAINVRVTDNRYIAVVYLLDEDGNELASFGSDTNVNAAAGGTYDYTFDLTGFDEVPDHLCVLVGDYAANESTYKINLNADELENGEVTVEIVAESDFVFAGSTIRLTAKVGPWGGDDRVTWRSLNPDIATVSDKGVVKGISEGEVAITATSVADTSVSDVIFITVRVFDNEYGAVVWDENSNVWFSKVTSADLPGYTKLTESASATNLASLCYDENGTLYGTTFKTSDWTSSLFIVNEKSYECTLVGASRIGYMDIAPAPSITNTVGSKILLGVYGPYVVVINGKTGDYITAYDFSDDLGGNYFVGISYMESGKDEDDGSPYDWYILIDESGEVYECGFLNVGGTYYCYYIVDDGSMGAAVDTPYFQSIYMDTEDNLIWTRFDGEENDVDFILGEYDGTEVTASYDLGSFETEVWPVGGIYEIGKSRMSTVRSGVSGVASKAAGRSANRVVNEVESLAPKAESKAVPAFDRSRLPIEQEGDVVINILAEEDVTNGHYVLVYDPEAYELIWKYCEAEYLAVNETEGKLDFAFVRPESFEEGMTMAKAILRPTEGSAADTTVSYMIVEVNDEKPRTTVFVIADDNSFAITSAFGDDGNGITLIPQLDGKYNTPASINAKLAGIGDVNFDGKVEAVDYLMVKRAVLGTYELTAAQMTAANVNGDAEGKIEAVDYLMIKRNVLGTYTIKGYDYSDYVLFFINAEGVVAEMITENCGDYAIADGGYVIAVPADPASGFAAFVAAAADSTVTVTLHNVDLDDVAANAALNLLLPGATFSVTVG